MTQPPKKPRRRGDKSGPSTPHAERTHRMIQVTLAPATREHLDAMQAADGVTRSALVGGLIDDEWARRAVDRGAGEEQERNTMILPHYFRATSRAPIDDTPSGLMAELLERVMGTPVRPYRADMKEAERRATQRLMHYAVCSLAARGVRYCDEACAVQVRVYLATDTSTVPTIGFTDLGGEIIDDAKSLWTIVTYRASSMEHMRARRMMEAPPSSQPKEAIHRSEWARNKKP